MSLNLFSAPNDLFSNGLNLALDNSVFALGGSILISKWRQKQNSLEYQPSKMENRLILGIEK